MDNFADLSIPVLVAIVLYTGVDHFNEGIPLARGFLPARAETKLYTQETQDLEDERLIFTEEDEEREEEKEEG